MADEIRPQDAWLQARFADYYRRNPLPAPDRFTRREFAFLFFGQKFMLRHLGFPTQKEFQEFLVRNGPAHAYYSTAFYQTPNARTMQEKGWLGAELIFDLDADHVPGAERLPYREQLDLVKRHFLRLVEEFILGDFGFREEDLLLTFSGGRGYHCHVLQDTALQLTSQERREIVDYVTATGLELERFIRPRTIGTKGFGRFAKAETTLEVPSSDSPGWGSRINHAVEAFAGQLKTMPPEQREKLLTETFPRVTKARQITLEKDLARLTEDRIRQGKVDVGPEIRRFLERRLTVDSIVPLSKGETDEPVTSDTKRLIRLPGSLHGKSGLRVVALRLDEVRTFDPLRDAVAFGHASVRVRLEKPSKVDVAGFVKELPVGEAEVPEAAAVMLVARGAAVPVT